MALSRTVLLDPGVYPWVALGVGAVTGSILFNGLQRGTVLRHEGVLSWHLELATSPEVHVESVDRVVHIPIVDFIDRARVITKLDGPHVTSSLPLGDVREVIVHSSTSVRVWLWI